MTLDIQARAWLDGVAESGLPPLNEMSVADARATYSAVVNQCGLATEDVADVRDTTVPGPAGPIPVRIYTPKGSGVFPTLVYYHGGGWVIGGLDVVDGLCRSLANRAHAVVISVDYRLAPEHPYPAAVEDAYAALTWVADNAAGLNIDAERLAVGGDSAGGNLAAVVALLARDQNGPPLIYQVLLYPATDFLRGTASYRDNGDGLFLTTDLMNWFEGHYRATADDWRASPLRASDLTGLPAALVVTAEFDPLRDEGKAYAARLREAGVETEMRRYDGQIHGFAANLAGVMKQGHVAVEDIGDRLRTVFRSGWQPRLWR